MGHYVVVGGSKGIGLHTVQLLLDKNHEVTVVSRTKPEIEAELLNYLSADIVTDDLGQLSLPEQIDGLLYAPGTINLKPLRSLKEEDFRQDYEINVIGAVKAIKACLSGLKKSEQSPSIVLFSTVAVGRGMPFHASISAAKGAIEGLTRSLAAELAPTIRVNAIAPSLVNTSLAGQLLSTPEKIENAAARHPLKKVGQPNDIAQIASYLLSSDAAWVTGQVIGVDGGLSVI